MSISASLQKAIKLQEKIEEMREQLAILLREARQELAGTRAVVELAPKPRRRGKAKAGKPAKTRGRVGSAPKAAAAMSPVAERQTSPVEGKPKNSGRAKGKGQGRGRSSLAGRKRASSPSGALAPAVVKVLEEKGEPMRVAEILAGLLKNGYVFNSSEPRKNLAARIYRLSGVRQVEPGLFYTA